MESGFCSCLRNEKAPLPEQRCRTISECTGYLQHVLHSDFLHFAHVSQDLQHLLQDFSETEASKGLVALMIAHDSTEIMSFFMIYINIECF